MAAGAAFRRGRSTGGRPRSSPPFQAAPALADTDLGKLALPLRRAGVVVELPGADARDGDAGAADGHLHPFTEHGAAFFDAAMDRMSDEVDAVQRATGC